MFISLFPLCDLLRRSEVSWFLFLDVVPMASQAQFSGQIVRIAFLSARKSSLGWIIKQTIEVKVSQLKCHVNKVKLMSSLGVRM